MPEDPTAPSEQTPQSRRMDALIRGSENYGTDGKRLLAPPLGSRVIGRPVRNSADLAEVIKRICEAYGLNPKHVQTVLSRDKAAPARQFVLRLLGVHEDPKGKLGRPADTEGDARVMREIECARDRGLDGDALYEAASGELAREDLGRKAIRGRRGGRLTVKALREREREILAGARSDPAVYWFEESEEAPPPAPSPFGSTE